MHAYRQSKSNQRFFFKTKSAKIEFLFIHKRSVEVLLVSGHLLIGCEQLLRAQNLNLEGIFIKTNWHAKSCELRSAVLMATAN